MFNNTWIIRPLRKLKVVFENRYWFKQDFTHFLKDFDIKPVITTIKKPQAKAPVERVHQVILNIIVTKDLDNKVFDHIDPWGETLSYIACPIKASYSHTIMATPGQYVFSRDMLFELASVVDW